MCRRRKRVLPPFPLANHRDGKCSIYCQGLVRRHGACPSLDGSAEHENALTNGGSIPDQFDYEVVMMPGGYRVGTLNDDFAFESIPGDIFQLGNTSYRVLKIETARVLVEDAQGLPPTIPFWLVMIADVAGLEGLPGNRSDLVERFIYIWLDYEAARPGASPEERRDRNGGRRRPPAARRHAGDDV